MKVIFLSNYFNYHQRALSDALYNVTDGNYVFVATSEMDSDRRQMRWDETTPSYVVDYLNADERHKGSIEKMICDFDVVIIGSAPYQMVKNRLVMGKLVFFYSERPLKQIYRFTTLCHSAIIHWTRWGRYKNAYLLAASAYAYPDYLKLLSFRNRAYKWGYFPKVRYYDDVSMIISSRSKVNKLKNIDVSILWVGRLIDWKHPDAAIEVAKVLRERGVRYELNIIGAGPLEKQLQERIDSYDLSSSVHLLGPIPPNEVRCYMESSQVLLFTSDRNEGWGAVLNEAMNSACAVVASNEIGSVPLLINNNQNGLVFHNLNWDDLFSKVYWLTNHADEMIKIQKNAYETIIDFWNAENAAKCLLKISTDILNGKPTSINLGPCSKAEKSINTII